MRFGGITVGCMTLVMALAFGSSAVASGHDNGHDDDDNGRLPRDARVEIDVLARIVERCGFQQKPDATPHSLDLSRSGTTSLDFKVDCNTPFAIGVSSAKGALSSLRTGDANGFRTRLPYQVGLKLNTSGSALTPRDCSSDSLSPTSAPGTGCAFFGDATVQGLSSEQHIAIGEEGRLTISWPDPDTGGPRLIAGALSDTITITIGARS